MKYEFTSDWFSQHIPIWQKFLVEYKDKPNLNFVEIGSFEGRSATWLFENILTNPSSRLTCIDIFDSAKHPKLDSNYYNRFLSNINPFIDQVTIHKGFSEKILKTFSDNELFDFAYIDGGHEAPQVITDAVLITLCLKKNGILIFDDYLWKHDTDKSPQASPKIAVDSFMEIFKRHFQLLHKQHQVILRKI